MHKPASSFSWEKLRYAIALERNPIAFKALFTTFHSDLLQFGLSIIRSKESVEDIISDLFLNIWTMEDKLMKIDQIKTYLFSSVKNNALKHLQRNREHLDIDSSDTSNYFTLSPEQTYISKENLETIYQAIDQLPLKCRMAFTLVKDLGHSYAETATIMDISVNTVDRHIQLAIKRLRDSLSRDKNINMIYSTLQKQ